MHADSQTQLDQLTLERDIEAALPPLESAGPEVDLAAFNAGRITTVIGNVITAVTQVAGGKLGAAAWPLVIAAARNVLAAALTSMGLPSALVAAAVELLVLILDGLKPAA
jgi:hypothetical protein